MAKSKAIYVAVAPLALLLVAGIGSHFLPILLGDDKDAADDQPSRLSVSHLPKPAVPAVAPTPLPPLDQKTQAALEKAVSGQISAFQKDDFVKALTFSTPMFRTAMTPERFRELIRSAYPSLMHSTAQKFERGKGSGSQAILPVLIASEDDTETRYIYILTRVNGNWLVTGCSPMGLSGGPTDRQKSAQNAPDLEHI